jgi:predicted small metal-binding protein
MRAAAPGGSPQIKQDRRNAGSAPSLASCGSQLQQTTEKDSTLMKTMTCQQLGGPCDFELSGTTADEVIKAQDKHLKAMVADGDSTHEKALNDMKGRWKRPISGMGWYRQVKRDFAALMEAD